jgi:hypothetical protein
MWQESGDIVDQSRDLDQVVDAGVVSQSLERSTGRLVAKFRLVSKGKERLMAAGSDSGTGNIDYLLRAQVGSLAGCGRYRERAVTTDIAAQFG